MKALVSGWFSFELMGATAGDLLARDVVCEWLQRAGSAFDVALAPPFEGGVSWQAVDPDDYTHLVFVCGPFGRSWQITQFLERFSRCRLIGVNLSMLESLDAWNPFHFLLERDSSERARPDVSLLSHAPRVPVVGVVLIDEQPEWRKHDVHDRANAEIESFVANRALAAVRIDTRLDINGTGLKTPAEIESLIARMDVVLTTRMHGLVLSLKNGVPVVAVDPVQGGHKVRRQAQTLGWPCVFDADDINQTELARAFDYCLTPDARAKASECVQQAREALASAAASFIDEVRRAAPRHAR